MSGLTSNPESSPVDVLKLVTWLVIASLFLGGVAHWLIFFQGGDVPFVEQDWPITEYHYAVLRDSMTERVIPYFVSPAAVDTRFLGSPETILSPQVALLPLTGLGNFVLVNTLLMYSLGFVGCLLIRNRFQLSLLPFVFLFLLFNFNGHITAHLAVGHMMWLGYFLLPFFFLLILQLAQHQGPPRLGMSLPLSIIVFGMVLQGSFHFFIWCLLFLALFGLFNRQHWKVAGLTIVLSLWLSVFRWLPAAFTHVGYSKSEFHVEYIFNTFIDALTTISAFQADQPPGLRIQSGPVAWWELDVFVGIIGVAFIAYFGIYQRFRANPAFERLGLRAFDLPILIFVLISFGVGYELVRYLGLPLISAGEQVPARFFIMSLAALIIISSIRMELLLDTFNRTVTLKLLSWAATGLMAYQLASHSWFWKIKGSAPIPDSLPDAVSRFTFNAVDQADFLYTTAVKLGVALSLIGIVVIVALYLWTVTPRRATRQHPS